MHALVYKTGMGEIIFLKGVREGEIYHDCWPLHLQESPWQFVIPRTAESLFRILIKLI